MKLLDIFVLRFRLAHTIIILPLIFYYQGVAQGNSSYDANSIPVYGSQNCVVGVDAFALTNPIGVNPYQCVAVGHSALYHGQGSQSTAIGHSALYNNSILGVVNTALGRSSLISNTIGSYNTGLGAYSDVGAGNLTNATAIGYGAIVSNSNSIQLGNSSVTTIYAGTGATAKFITGGLQVTGGSPGVGKVLVSDASGNATWQTLPPAGGSWSLNGNAGTIDGTDFIGTTDNVAFNIRVNNLKAGRLDPALFNTFYGITAGNNNTTGGANTALGYNALFSNSRGEENTAVGYNSLYSNVRGMYNTAGGVEALYSNVDGISNTAMGYRSLYSNTTGISNTAVGYNALYANTAVSALTAIGYNALYSNTDGINNTAVGYNALYTNDRGAFNTANGHSVLYSNANGNYNTATGFEALYANTSGHLNTAVGYLALRHNTTGRLNVAVGDGALYNNTEGWTNVAIGDQALFSKTGYGADANVAVGGVALYENTSGERNTAVGWGALRDNITGFGNVGLGYGALINTLGSFNTGVGMFADGMGTFTNATAIGAYSQVNADNKIRLGDVFVTEVETQTAYTTVSDGRFKNNISESDVKGLDFINRLRPVVYNFDARKFQEFLIQDLPDSSQRKYFDRNFEKISSIRQSGFIAQEVEIAAKESNYIFNGVHTPKSGNDNYSLSYSQFVVPLVKAVQELSNQNETMQQEIKDQRSVNESLRKEIDELREMIRGIVSEEGNIKITTVDAEARLFQNMPNPFSQSTIIRYVIPAGAKGASLIVANLSGVKVKEFNLKNNDRQNVEISGGQLSAGTYVYSLVVDGILVDSKIMILTR